MENELRLGNLFILRGKIVEFDDKLMHSVIYGGLEGSEPIPLTEEWLLKFGFEKTGAEEDNHYDIFSINYDTDWYIEYYKSTFTSMISIREVLHMVSDNQLFFNTRLDYVHELQNFYYSITKQELTMK